MTAAMYKSLSLPFIPEKFALREKASVMPIDLSTLLSLNEDVILNFGRETLTFLFLKLFFHLASISVVRLSSS